MGEDMGEHCIGDAILSVSSAENKSHTAVQDERLSFSAFFIVLASKISGLPRYFLRLFLRPYR